MHLYTEIFHCHKEEAFLTCDFFYTVSHHPMAVVTI